MASQHVGRQVHMQNPSADLACSRLGLLLWRLDTAHGTPLVVDERGMSAQGQPHHLGVDQRQVPDVFSSIRRDGYFAAKLAGLRVLHDRGCLAQRGAIVDMFVRVSGTFPSEAPMTRSAREVYRGVGVRGCHPRRSFGLHSTRETFGPLARG